MSVVVVLMAACSTPSSGNETTTSCTDPAGTRSVVIEACYPGACSRNNELDLETGFLGDSCKSGITDLSYLSQNLTVDGCNRAAATIVDVGRTCLAQVKDPGRGYSKNVAAVEGHRYFMKSLEGNPFALSVDGYTQNVGGGIAGVRVRYFALSGGTGGDAGSATPTASETVNGTPICPLGWSGGLSAKASGSTIEVTGDCGSSDRFQLRFSPTPAPGGTAPAVGCNMAGAGASAACGIYKTDTPAMGSISLSGSTPNLRVTGSCDCTPDAGGVAGRVTFDLPLTVQ